MIAENEIQQRELSPKAHLGWLEERQGEYSHLEKAYSAWVSRLASMDELFEKHVYNNEEFSDSDARQHRIGLSHMMAVGEQLAFDFLAHGEKNGRDVKNYVALIDQKLSALRRTLSLWHGSIEDQNDLPESLKKGMQEIESGKVVDMERALDDIP